MNQVIEMLIDCIDNDKKLQDLCDWYEVRKALARVKYLIGNASEHYKIYPPDVTVSRHLRDEDFTLTDAIDAVVDLNGLIGVGLISLGDQLKEYCYSKA